jgi:hypothetical protein
MAQDEDKAAAEGDAKDAQLAKKEAARQKLQAAAKKAKDKLTTAVGEKEDKRAKLAEAVKKAKSKLSSTGAEGVAAPEAYVPVPGGEASVLGDGTDAAGAAAAYQYQLQLAAGEVPLQAPPMPDVEEQVDMESPAQQAYLSLVALGQIAEESCTFASSAATFVASAGTFDPNETSQMSVAAQQACDRSKSASETLQTYTRDFRGLREAQDWIHALVMKVQKDAETCEQAAQSCHHLSNAITKNKKQSVSPVPCRWFLQGKCHKGMQCTFLHDLSVLEPRPLTKKTTFLCRFFDTKDGCIRGPSCPHAHGEKELDRIKELVARMKKRKMYKLHETDEPWVEDEYSDSVKAAAKPALMPLPFLAMPALPPP